MIGCLNVSGCVTASRAYYNPAMLAQMMNDIATPSES